MAEGGIDTPEIDTTGAGDESGGRTPRRRRRRLILVLTGVSLVVAVAVGVVAVRWVRGSAHQVSVDEATVPTGSTLPATPAVLRPAQGVYAYEGSGTDRLDKPPKEQAEGPQMPGTVTHRPDGCWTFRIDYSSNHWQSWVYCPRPHGGLDEGGGQTYQKWDFGAFVIESTSTFTCADSVTIRAGQRPGDSWTQTCTGSSTSTPGATRSSGTTTFVGPTTVEVGGEEVAALHYRRERTMTGDQRGTERTDAWFAADTGLPLRDERSVEASTSSVIGDVTYTEEAGFHLTSMTPRS